MTLASNPDRRVLRRLTTDDVGNFLGVQDIFEDLDGESLGNFSAREMKRTLKNRLVELEANQQDLLDTHLGVNIGWLAAKLKLGLAEQRVIAYAVLRHSLPTFLQTLEFLNFECSPEHTHEAFSCMLALPVAKMRLALSAKSALIQSGLVKQADASFSSIEDRLEVPENLCRILLASHRDVDSLLESFFSEATPAKLKPEDFSHLADDFQLISIYLQNVQSKREPGVNILLYGDSGVGKSEFARLVAKNIGQRLYEVACADDEGEAINGQARFASFMLSQKMLASAADCIVLFDEIEDVFPCRPSGFLAFLQGSDDDSSASPGKAWINRVLETNPVPAIWISNSIDQIDPAYLRRFDFALEFPKPPKDARCRIAKKYLVSAKATPGFIERISAWDNLTPSQIEKAAKLARIVAGSPAATELLVERALKYSAKLLGQPMLSTGAGQSPGYDLAYLNTSIATAPLITGLRARPSGTFCFHGAPGTGKTAFARHLADNIGKPLLVRRASDLLGKYVGESEQNIAKMFQKAQKEDAVLVLDEADSLLADRRGAHQSWEVTQVNELLTQMEDFQGIFICTTNQLDRLDPASLRRFAFKIRFDCLNREQRQLLFDAELERLAPGSGTATASVITKLNRLDKLTPGDFAAVAKQWALWATQPSADSLVTALEEECRVKGSGGQAIGFMA
ncbi:AAA family ATPase [Propionivibrio sp.]|uniref:AAA family ATPase n=1 Tax=Propionivibrio sp. TaxID=2212460 RepID=UPI003BEF8897